MIDNIDMPFSLDAPEDKPIQGPAPKIELEVKHKDVINFRSLHPDKFIVSNSDLKEVFFKGEYIDYCPFLFMHKVHFRDVHIPPTESMLKGSYFETHVLGSGAGGKMITDLPRKTLTGKKAKELQAAGMPLIGDKTIDQVRIDVQIERFLLKAKSYGIELLPGINVQVPILKHLWDDVYYVGELDLFPVVINFPMIEHVLAIIDVKLTEDVNSMFRKGATAFCWGDPDSMDHNQGVGYLQLVKDIDYKLNPHFSKMLEEIGDFNKSNIPIRFFYWVWGYKQPLEEQEKWVEVTDDQIKISEFKETVRKYVALVESYLAQDVIPKNPLYGVCKKCPFNPSNGGDCSEANNIYAV